MNTLELNRRIEAVLAAFEHQSGQAVPTVTPLADLCRDYCNWSQRNHLPAQSVTAFLLALARKTGGIPCRMSDGTVGVIGITPKAMMATGVMQ